MEDNGSSDNNGHEDKEELKERFVAACDRLKARADRQWKAQLAEEWTHQTPDTPPEPDAIAGARETELAWQTLGEGEYGDAKLFAHIFADRLCYDHAQGQWYRFGAHHWQRDAVESTRLHVGDSLSLSYLSLASTLLTQATQKPEDATQLRAYADAAIERAKKLRQLGRTTHVLTFGESFLGVDGSAWDADPWLLGVANGVVDLHTGELRDGQPGDKIRTASPATYTSLDTPAPAFERFIGEILNDDADLIAFAQRLLGYSLVGATVEHILPVLCGAGRNGKDTLLELLAHVLGPLAGPVSTDVLLASARGRQTGNATPHLCELQGRRLAWCSETDEGARLNAGQTKLITGGGTIVARPLYGKPVRFAPQHLLMLITNSKPSAPAHDYALWKRLLVVPFERSFVDDPKEANERKRDAYILDKLRPEAAGILAWLVRGCLAWQTQGLHAPASVTEATDEYQAGEDAIKQFIGACCIESDTLKTRSSLLYHAYTRWLLSAGFDQLNEKRFGQQMGKIHEKKRQKTGNHYLGIGLVEERTPEA